MSVKADHTARRERLEARITADQKALLQRAAHFSGRSLTDFVVSSAQDAALRTIREHETVALGQADTQAFITALLEDSEPTEALRKAAEQYRSAK